MGLDKWVETTLLRFYSFFKKGLLWGYKRFKWGDSYLGTSLLNKRLYGPKKGLLGAVAPLRSPTECDIRHF